MTSNAQDTESPSTHRLRSLGGCVLLALVLCAWSALANDFLKEFAKPLERDQVFYRWQSTTSGENLVQMGRMNAATNAHFMGLKEEIAAGPGLYFAASPLSSSDYMPKTGGNLIEVKVPRGTYVLDLTDPDTRTRLRQADVQIDSLHAGAHAEDGLVMKYTKDWFVGKNLADRAEFRMYPGPDQSDDALLRTWNLARNTKPKLINEQVARQVAGARPEFIRKNFSPAKLEGPILQALSPREVADAVRIHLGENTNGATIDNFMDYLAKDPQALPRLEAEDRKVYDRVARVLVGHYQSTMALLDKDQAKVVTSLAAWPGAGVEAQHDRIVGLVDRALANSQSGRGLVASADVVAPLLRMITLNERDRAMIGQRLQTFARGATFYGDEASPLREVARAASLHDPDVLASIESVGHRFDLVTRAIETGKAADVRAALRGHADRVRLQTTIDRLRDKLPNDEVNEALRHYVTTHPEEYAGLLRRPLDFTYAVRAGVGYDVDFFAAEYAAALKADEAARVGYVEACLRTPKCVEKFDRATRLDRGLIFRDLREPEKLSNALALTKHNSPERARGYALMILRKLQDPERVDTFVRSISQHRGPPAPELVEAAAKQTRALARLSKWTRPTDHACQAAIAEAVR